MSKDSDQLEVLVPYLDLILALELEVNDDDGLKGHVRLCAGVDLGAHLRVEAALPCNTIK